MGGGRAPAGRGIPGRGSQTLGRKRWSRRSRWRASGTARPPHTLGTRGGGGGVAWSWCRKEGGKGRRGRGCGGGTRRGFTVTNPAAEIRCRQAAAVVQAGSGSGEAGEADKISSATAGEGGVDDDVTTAACLASDARARTGRGGGRPMVEDVRVVRPAPPSPARPGHNGRAKGVRSTGGESSPAPTAGCNRGHTGSAGPPPPRHTPPPAARLWMGGQGWLALAGRWPPRAAARPTRPTSMRGPPPPSHPPPPPRTLPRTELCVRRPGPPRHCAADRRGRGRGVPGEGRPPLGGGVWLSRTPPRFATASRGPHAGGGGPGGGTAPGGGKGGVMGRSESGGGVGEVWVCAPGPLGQDRLCQTGGWLEDSIIHYHVISLQLKLNKNV